MSISIDIGPGDAGVQSDHGDECRCASCAAEAAWHDAGMNAISAAASTEVLKAEPPNKINFREWL